MKNGQRFAQAMIEILESEGVEYIFGHPGEQILSIYEALRTSEIKHVLMRHEQGAAHAADAYARISGKFGVCLASAGPGALNLTMGVATAYKDSVPLLVITGDVPTELKGCDAFQEVETSTIFKSITIQSFQIKSPQDGILKLKEALNLFRYGKTGPIHLSIPRDVLGGEVDNLNIDDMKSSHADLEMSDEEVGQAIKLMEEAQKPLIIAGAGVSWSKSVGKLLNFADKNKIPVSTTYPARGVFPDDNPLFLGMIGVRGTEAAQFAGKNADVVIALGARLSERTMIGVGKCKTIQVNLDEKSLKGDINILEDVGTFLDSVMDLDFEGHGEWLADLEGYSRYYDVGTDFDDVPVKPQRAIKEILDATGDSLVINDAGSHTTWVTILQRIKEPGTFIFSGGFAPMGYAIPGAVGSALAKPDTSVVVVVGDGGFQMTSQELATIVQLNLPVVICLVNNSALGIIKQWQNIHYGKTFEVELENPDFIKLAESYGIEAIQLNRPGEIYPAVKRAINLMKPYLIEVVVDRDEEVPLPKRYFE